METEASHSKEKENSVEEGKNEEMEIENGEQGEGQDIADETETSKSGQEVKIITENGKSARDIKVGSEEYQLPDNGELGQGQDIAVESESGKLGQDVNVVTENGKSGEETKGAAEEDQLANQQVEQLQARLAEEKTPVHTKSDILPSEKITKEDNPLEIDTKIVDDDKNVQLECNPSQSVLDKGLTYSENKSMVEHSDRSVKPDIELFRGLEVKSAQPIKVQTNDTDVSTECREQPVIPDEKPPTGNKEEKVKDDIETSKESCEGLAGPDTKTSMELGKDPVKTDTEIPTEHDKEPLNLDAGSARQQQNGLVINDRETSTGQVKSMVNLDTETPTKQGSGLVNPVSITSTDLDTGLGILPTEKSTEFNHETPRLDAEIVTDIRGEVPDSKVQSDSCYDSSTYKEVSVIADPAEDGEKKDSSGASQRKADDAQKASIENEDSEPVTPHVISSNLKEEEGADLSNQVHGLESTPLTSDGVSGSKNCFLLDEMSESTDSGTEEEQSAFKKELEHFFREKSMDFKPPKFYGRELNCLKLWRAVIRLGGYEKVTSCKLWRQVGESFRPPKTCTTVSWTFRSFYEKALLEYERHKASGGELNIPLASPSEPMKVDNQGSGAGRARRDSAARAMQGWHSQRGGNGQAGDPITKDKNSIPPQKREKHLGSVGLLKRKSPPYAEHGMKTARPKLSKTHVDVDVVDVGAPADWVKINVQRTKDCFEVYALVPGLLREEVRVQSDAIGRLVICGEPENLDNPWGISPFKKVVSFPSRVDPHQTSAVVTLNGQLFVRVPFEQSD